MNRPLLTRQEFGLTSSISRRRLGNSPELPQSQDLFTIWTRTVPHKVILQPHRRLDVHITRGIKVFNPKLKALNLGTQLVKFILEFSGYGTKIGTNPGGQGDGI